MRMEAKVSGPDSLLSMRLTSNSATLRAEAFLLHSRQLVNLIAKTSVPSPDELVAVQNLLEQLHFLIEADLAENDKDDNDNDKIDDNDDDEELRHCRSPCLRLLLVENVLGHALATARMPIEPKVSELLLRQQLQLLCLVVSESRSEEELDRLLKHNNFGKPLKTILDFFEKCLNYNNNDNNLNKANMTTKETKSSLVLLVTSLCHRLSSSECLRRHFLTVVSEPNSESIEDPQMSFVIFKILLNFVHDTRNLGQQARNAIVACLVVAKDDEIINDYLVKKSNFCEFLAAGLAGLYSSLPRRLPRHLELDLRWHHLDSSMENASPELQSFLSSLTFCDIVAEISHPRLRAHLLALIYIGFLMPVLAPALVQSVEFEVLCSTAYLDLFFRKLQHRPVVSIFLRFLFTDSKDSRAIADEIITRLKGDSKLCHITLGLFETVLSFHSEDVLLMLVFRHLIELQHLVLASRFILGQSDPHGAWSDALLALTPICTQAVKLTERVDSPNSGSSDLSLQRMTEKFNAYLVDAKAMVRARYNASRDWLYDYDGVTPVCNNQEVLRVITEEANKEGIKCGFQLRLSTSSSSCSPSAGPVSMTESEERDFWNLLTKDSAVSEISVAKAMQYVKDSERLVQGHDLNNSNFSLLNNSDLIPKGVSSLGPFLDSLIELVSEFPSNQLTLNLMATSLLSQLAAYPHPLLRDTLLSPDLVFQPGVRSLQRCIGTLRMSLDNIMPSLNGADEALVEARDFLQHRLENEERHKGFTAGKNERTHVQRRASTANYGNNSLGDDGHNSRPSLGSAFSSMFRRRGGNNVSNSASGSSIASASATPVSSASSAPPSLISTHENQQHQQLKGRRRQLSLEVKRYAMAAVLLEEWLQELAAIAQEHTILEREMDISNKIAYNKSAMKSSNDDMQT